MSLKYIHDLLCKKPLFGFLVLRLSFRTDNIIHVFMYSAKSSSAWILLDSLYDLFIYTYTERVVKLFVYD